MFDDIKKLINNASLAQDSSGASTSFDLKISILTLLFALANSDSHLDGTEIGTITGSLFRALDIPEQETGDLLEIAKFLVDDNAGLVKMMGQIRENFNQDQRQLILSILWRVIVADGNIHHYETKLAAEIRDGLGLSMEQAIRARKIAELEETAVLISKFAAASQKETSNE